MPFVVYVQSRPALSLLGYCYYQLQDFVNAADCYEQLTVLNPEVDDYRLYYAQSLYKANLFDEAMKVSSQIDGSVYNDKVCQVCCLMFNLSVARLKLPGNRVE